MKKKIKIILLIVLIFVGITIYICSKDNLKFKFSYEIANYDEYSNGKSIKVNIPINNKIKYINNKELLKLFKEGTGIVYFGYSTCPWCRNSVPILIDVAKKNKLKVIYYYDIHEENLDSIKKELYEILDPYLREKEDGKKDLSVPDVYAIKKGKIKGHHIGTVSSYKNPTKGMNKKQKKELEDIYDSLIKEVK